MYISGSGKTYSQQEMMEILKSRIIAEKEKGNRLKIIIGGDSHPFIDIDKRQEYVFAIAIALHIVGSGGIFFIRKFRTKMIHHLSEQLFMEATESLADAYGLKDAGILDMVHSVEIHCDAGNNGASKDYAAAIKGMVESFGFRGYIKPDAAIASTLADKFTK
jgi:hypothetical protein